MRVTSIGIKNFRCFESLSALPLANITLLIGENNSGKSSLIKALYAMQEGANDLAADVRIGTGAAVIDIGLAPVDARGWSGELHGVLGTLSISLSTADRRNVNVRRLLRRESGSGQGSATSDVVNALPAREPLHFIVPHLSKRKAAGYIESVGTEQAMLIQANQSNLPGKLQRIGNPQFPAYAAYNDASRRILGFTVTAIPSDAGAKAGIYQEDGQPIYVDQMGDGVPHLAAFLADLAWAKGKLFLIEEPENDLHPAALKSLLNLILASSKNNQFVISTHSHIVVRHLGGESGTLTYQISRPHGDSTAPSTIREIEPSPQSRLRALQDLGYSLSDFDLWEGWLILEESSAEKIIRDYLIPWFVPRLSRVRTLAAGGVEQVEPTVRDLHRLALFTHLEPLYREHTWVRVDGDASGQSIAHTLNTSFSTWKPGRIGQFKRAQFELYYPSHFKEEVDRVLAITDRSTRRSAKRQLLLDVCGWLDEDKVRGVASLKESAAEVINLLEHIASEI